MMPLWTTATLPVNRFGTSISRTRPARLATLIPPPSTATPAES